MKESLEEKRKFELTPNSDSLYAWYVMAAFQENKNFCKSYKY